MTRRSLVPRPTAQGPLMPGMFRETPRAQGTADTADTTDNADIKRRDRWHDPWHDSWHNSLGKLVFYLACFASKDGRHASHLHFCCAPRCFESWFLFFALRMSPCIAKHLFFAAWQLLAPVIHTQLTP